VSPVPRLARGFGGGEGLTWQKSGSVNRTVASAERACLWRKANAPARRARAMTSPPIPNEGTAPEGIGSLYLFGGCIRADADACGSRPWCLARW
jgi:hypothetical protein